MTPAGLRPLICYVEEFWPPAAEGRGERHYGWFPLGPTHFNLDDALRELNRCRARDPIPGRYRVVVSDIDDRRDALDRRALVDDTAAEPDQGTMYDRYGDAAIRAVVDASYAKFEADPQLGQVFFGRDIGRLKRHQYMVFRIIMGATGRGLREALQTLKLDPDTPPDLIVPKLLERLKDAHAHLGLTEDHLQRVAGLIREAAVEGGMHELDAAELWGTVMATRPYVVAARRGD